MGKIKFVVLELNKPTKDAIERLQNIVYSYIEEKEIKEEIKEEEPTKSAS